MEPAKSKRERRAAQGARILELQRENSELTDRVVRIERVQVRLQRDQVALQYENATLRAALHQLTRPLPE